MYSFYLGAHFLLSFPFSSLLISSAAVHRRRLQPSPLKLQKRNFKEEFGRNGKDEDFHQKLHDFSP